MDETRTTLSPPPDVRPEPVEPPPSPRAPLIGRLEIWIAAAIVLLDQVTKAIVRGQYPCTTMSR